MPERTKTRLGLAVDATVMGEVVPTMTITTNVEVQAVGCDGSMRLRMTIADVAAKDQRKDGAAAMMTAQLAPLKGMAVSALLMPTGEMTDVKLVAGDQPAAASDMLSSVTDNFARLAMPLPSVPVGVGARWRSTRVVEQGGIAMTIVTNVTLTARDGDVLHYTMTTTASSEKSTVKP